MNESFEFKDLFTDDFLKTYTTVQSLDELLEGIDTNIAKFPDEYILKITKGECANYSIFQDKAFMYQEQKSAKEFF